jgi:Protein of unknown function (DUF1203)
MSFRISGLSPEPFRHLYGLSDEALAAHGARRYVADESPGFPDRIELRDAKVDERLLLVNYEHHAANSPYRSRYAIFVLEGAEETYDRVGEIPDVLSRRLLSLRAFSHDGMLLKADVVEGAALEPLIAAFFHDSQIAYIHAHNARQGCYAARIDRA